MTRVVTAQELSEHGGKDSCWMAILGKVYDLTDFLTEHPGGSAILLRHSGKDATKEFEKFHSEDMIERVLPDSVIVGDYEDAGAGEAAPQFTVGDEDETPKASSTGNSTAASTEGESEVTIDMMLNAMDFKAVAEKKVSPEGWAYLYSAAGDEFSYAENEDAFARHASQDRDGAESAGGRQQGWTARRSVLGRHFDVPFYMTAVAMAKLYNPDGEKCAARGVSKMKRAGIDMPYMVPTLASCGLRDIMSACDPSLAKWYQLYVNPSEKVVESMITRIVDYGFAALFITVDAPELGMRERDMRVKVRQSAAVQGGAKQETAGVARAISSFISQSLCWENIPKISTMAREKAAARGGEIDIFLKGIHSPVDAVRAYRERHRLGVRGIVVSNHGARQVDTVKSGVQMLYECTRALGKAGWLGRGDPEFSVFVDGGVRRGTDILKCIALGASAVGIGRPFMTAMAAFGEDGMVRLANLLREDIITNMRLLGCRTLDELNEDFLDARAMEHPPPGKVRARY
ncbi:Cytochrome b2, mitochondrial precursor [Perkinsus olseni]|uniref:Cytochrome b2, mitochondrial n=1 Tax=Perkinsus olseni TaxID=32597 RepID=A0A7J6P2E2_PEROL|nr:Cytochrome b2, mitochondrial precursor [Perkinsus olseni]